MTGSRAAAVLCWCAVALEGFDLVVLGVVFPPLLRDPSWGLTPGSASLIAVVGLVGVMVGALAAGPVADRIGRRRAMLLTVAWFSVCTLLCAAAPGPVLFGVLRFVVGLGLGGVLPVALAVVSESSGSSGSGGSGRAGTATTTMMTGYHAGAVLTSLLGILVLPTLGWRAMFVLGALPAVVLLPLLASRLPSGPAAPRDARPALGGALVRGGYLRPSLAFWTASFMGLLLVYGLNTWLPEIMRSAGYELGAALALLLVLNVGAVVGLLVAGRVADRLGMRRVTPAWFVAGAVFLALLAIRLPGVWVYVGVLLAGVFVFSAQVLVYAQVGRFYPDPVRATALGAASGVGRLGAIVGPPLGGELLAAGIAYPWGFHAFAAVAVLGAVAMLVVGRRPSAAPEPAVPAV